MLQDLLSRHSWLLVPLWALAYLGDYYLTLYAARLYRKVRESILFEGSYELTPRYQDDVNRLALWSPRFLRTLIVSSLALLAMWAVSVLYLQRPFAYRFLMGALLLSQAVVHIRHLRNIALFRTIGDPHGLKGRSEYPRWLSYHTSAVEFACFAALYLLLAIGHSSWFLCGGAFSCASVSVRHWRWSRKARAARRSGDKP